MNDILEALRDISSRLWVLKYEQAADVILTCQDLSISIDDLIKELEELGVAE